MHEDGRPGSRKPSGRAQRRRAPGGARPHQHQHQHQRGHRDRHALSLGLSVLLLFAAAPAQAYLDPSTGSMILQLILGGVAGAIMVAKLYWERVKAFFGMSSDPEDNRDPDGPSQVGSSVSTTDAD